MKITSSLSRPFPPVYAHKSISGMTLVELLLVLILLTFLGTLSTGIALEFGSTNSQFRKESVALEYYLEQIRTIATTQNRHCYVGFFPDSPSSTHQPSKGNLDVIAFSRADGLKGFDLYNPADSWVTETLVPWALTPCTPTQHYPHLQLAPSLPPPDSGPMARPNVTRSQRIGHPDGDSVTPINFATPDGSRQTQRVLHIAPDGSTQIVHQNTANRLAAYVEISLVPPASAAKQTQVTPPQAALVINGLTGKLTRYSP